MNSIMDSVIKAVDKEHEDKPKQKNPLPREWRAGRDSHRAKRDSESRTKKTQHASGEGRPDVVTRLCMVVDWCIDHPEYTTKIKVIPKKDYPILMPCEF